ncbi:hypothetical protein COX75_00345 [bacterium (Candidatus Gribaldobacteria) CG_4_10_14_0_2_um_filter_33_15]|nr:MAG: hypothetical protein COU04_00505 [bacterium (Candidatus Gribaldobacteria) CG10_big_fil_rev_8_21_14_0_10_33_41]PJA01249.1 MAG: hypothetical protein COX75_00345 [bacterium (Candidatus Gribaldobacteria) CG_4_10_14_0_2_um_filter_33_15]PJB08377.1 MAG: hypothetical protein CO122_01930 [bacterium (Candidatus Gribaldobacteria) CG_4_9_14_3_um_filter_33_9]
MTVVVSNSEKLEELKNKIIKDGVENLHVLADFDRTLTKAFVNGQSRPSLTSVLRDGNYLTQNYASKAHGFYNKYHAIEIDTNIPHQKKKKAMEEWWTLHFDLLIKSGLNKKHLKEIVNSGKVEFRQNALELMDILKERGIPLVIMSSSGLGGDAIAMMLEKERKLYNNIYIISNSFKWDKKGNAVEVKKPIIHVINKDETMIKDFPEIYKKIKDRKNVILLGDNIEDLGMIIGFDYKNLLKIGFLNENIEENLEKYKKSFDVLILNDGSINYLNNLIKEL